TESEINLSYIGISLNSARSVLDHIQQNRPLNAQNVADALQKTKTGFRRKNESNRRAKLGTEVEAMEEKLNKLRDGVTLDLKEFKEELGIEYDEDVGLLAQSTPVADSWGFARFVNVRDGKGETPLHLASRQRRPECVRILLDSGSLACASTSGYGCPGSTPLHLDARGGSLDYIRELLAWGADRLQRDSSGRIPYLVAVKYKHGACAALLNPSAAEPLVWPSPLKFISELNPDAKVLLESVEANKEREKDIFKGTPYSLPSPSHSDAEIDDNISEARGLKKHLKTLHRHKHWMLGELGGEFVTESSSLQMNRCVYCFWNLNMLHFVKILKKFDKISNNGYFVSLRFQLVIECVYGLYPST
ncbi:hypothetical protein MKW98_021517, partial [Papaver atlanticum]